MRNSTGDKFDAEDLIQRYRDGISTKEERQLIESWYETIQLHRSGDHHHEKRVEAASIASADIKRRGKLWPGF